MKNVFAQRPVNRALTKTKPVYHHVKHVLQERVNHCQGKVCVAKAQLALHVICKVSAPPVTPIIIKEPTTNALPVLLARPVNQDRQAVVHVNV
jgi:hypothetical protein